MTLYETATDNITEHVTVKGTIMQNEKALINDRLRVSKVS